jgi:predicted phosphodiesterase
MAQRVILSDLHFGDPLCSLRRKKVTEGLSKFLRGLGEVEEIILAGDILDANISSLTTAIKGRKGTGSWPRQLGFQKWLSFIFEGGQFNAKKIIYVPGNHDYIIWNILSTNKAFVKPLSRGQFPENLPLMEAVFPEPFIRGVAPQKMQDRFIVAYPDHEFSLAGRSVLVTHGHYLDNKQSLFKGLRKFVREEKGKEGRAVRKFFIRTAMYQAAANSISYTKFTREFVDEAHKKIGGIFDIIGKLRNKPIDKDMLRAIEMYLRYFRIRKPDVFIFGHTHEASRSETRQKLIKKPIEVWNDGSFIEEKGEKRAGTFILANSRVTSDNQVKVYQIDLKGNVFEKNVKKT